MRPQNSCRGPGSAREVSMTRFWRLEILRQELWKVKTRATHVTQRQAAGLPCKGNALHRRRQHCDHRGSPGGPCLPNCRTETRLPVLAGEVKKRYRRRPKIEELASIFYHSIKKWGWRKGRENEKCLGTQDAISRALCLATGSGEEGGAVCWMSGSQ